MTDRFADARLYDRNRGATSPDTSERYHRVLLKQVEPSEQEVSIFDGSHEQI